MRLHEKISGYKCMGCGSEYPITPFIYTCGSCGENLDILFKYEEIRDSWSKADLRAEADSSIWRYHNLLPVESVPKDRSICVGNTPLVKSESLASSYNLKDIWIKDDTRNPSGSLKDRASEVGIQHAIENGFELIVAASTGNAAASLAALTAFYGKKALILVPADAPIAKLTQILQYGATLCRVDGSYDDAFDLSLEISEKYGWYSRSTGINPILSEGKKTVALEIAEQLEWNTPDYVFVPVGDGCIIGGVHKGFYDLHRLGWIDKIPKIIAVQSDKSSAIVDALESNRAIEPVEATTIADSISVSRPRDALKALRAVRESSGFGIKVSDEEILAAQKILASSTGIFSEPAGAASLAGLMKASRTGLIDSADSAVILATGSGLKDIKSAQKLVSAEDPIPPNLGSFESFIKGKGLGN